MTVRGHKQVEWTRKQEITVCQMREAGKTISECAAAVGKSYGAVAVRLSKLGVCKKLSAPRRKPGGFLEAVKKLCFKSNGQSRQLCDSRMALILNSTTQEVFKARKKLGISRRTSQSACVKKSWMTRRRKKKLDQGAWSGNRNDTPLTKSQQDLITSHLYVLSEPVVLGRIRRNPSKQDEIESAAMYGLVIAARSYKSVKEFARLARKSVRLNITRELLISISPLGYRRANKEQKERRAGETIPKVTSLNSMIEKRGAFV